MTTRKLRTVLSLFDGMSCGQIALNELGVAYNTYYASEIDQNAINHTQLNFPDTIQLGDVTRWKEWDIDWSSVDLILAGSPCQGFSRNGAKLRFDDPRSKLYWEFSAILKHVTKYNPNVKWLLENVKMQQTDLSVISNDLKVYPQLIDSADFSAQTRERLYWTNIRVEYVREISMYKVKIPLNNDLGIRVVDILEKGWREREVRAQDLWYTKQPYKYVGRNRYYRALNGSFSQSGHVVDVYGKSYTLGCANGSSGKLFYYGNKVLRFTPRELMRLQTVPDWYKMASEHYRDIKNIVGNGWTVKVIEHILSFL